MSIFWKAYLDQSDIIYEESQLYFTVYWDSDDVESLESRTALKEEFVLNYLLFGRKPIMLTDLPPHSLRTLAWMQSVEDGDDLFYYALNEFPFDDDRSVELSNTEIGPTTNIREKYKPVRGGIIADEPGIGKTITTIAFCHSRPIQMPEDSTEDFMYQLHVTRTEPKKYHPELDVNKRISSKATLILVPNNISNQWVEEFEKCLGKACKLKKFNNYERPKLIDLAKEISRTVSNIATMEQELANGRGEARELNRHLRVAEQRLTEIQNELQGTQAQYNYFKNFADSYADRTNDTNCAICLEDRIVKQDAGVLPCGHAFCRECANEVVRTTQSCPTCRARTELEEVIQLSPPKEKEAAIVDSKKLEL
ncbi:hypothetical protein HK098_006384 [Nowakowskiella sp. JEL0407]|nr:hypothetical protein HK098_006384 [Nowakowskiella sp. JEL0407]